MTKENRLATFETMNSSEGFVTFCFVRSSIDSSHYKIAVLRHGETVTKTRAAIEGVSHLQKVEPEIFKALREAFKAYEDGVYFNGDPSENLFRGPEK